MRAKSLLLLSAGLMAMAAAQSAAAQTSGAQAAPASGDQSSVETIVVTATGTNIAGVKSVGSEAVTISQDQIQATGLTNTDDLLQTIPQVQNNSGGGPALRLGGTTGYGGNPTQGTAINLRGIGAAATLTLVDGRRLAPSGASNNFTEAIQVPLSAIDHVDVVVDGASAIYGADAVSGVVNYVLRKNYEGVEISARDTTNNMYDEAGFSITAGRNWTLGKLGEGNVILTIDYDHRWRGLESNSPYTSQDLTRFGGLDNRILNGTVTPGNPGDLVVQNSGNATTPYSYYGLPANFAGTNPTLADLTAANIVDAAKYTDYFPDQKRTQLAAFLNQELTPWLSVYYEGFYTNRNTVTKQYTPNTGASFTVCPTSPYYVHGVPNTPGTANAACPTGGETFYYDFFNSIGPTVSSNPDLAYTQTVGLKADLPFQWKGEAYFTGGMDRTCGICNIGDNVNLTVFGDEVNSGAINPFSTTPLTAAQKASFLGTNVQWSRNTIQDAVIKFNGPLFRLPAGQVKVALGGEFTSEHESLTNGSNTDTAVDGGNTNTFYIENVADNSRRVQSAFGEIYIPIIGGSMNVPFVQSLDLNAAVRYDHYSDFGGTTNPKIALTWAVNNDLSLRASWGTSFRAPALTDISPIVFSAELVDYPLTNLSGNSAIKNGVFAGIPGVVPGLTSAIEILGNNPTLKPEQATTWSAGVDYKPHYIPGLQLSMTYYRIDYTDQIAGPPVAAFLTSPANSALYSKYITPINNPTTCVAGDPSTYDPKLASFLANTIADYVIPIFDGGNPCAVNVILDGRETNLATTIQDGLDFSGSYNFQIGQNRLNLTGSITDVLEDKQASGPGTPMVNVLDTLTYPVSLRGRIGLNWMRGAFTAGVFVNYVGSYVNNVPLVVNNVARPNQTIPAWTTADLNLAWRAPDDIAWTALKGVKASLNILNFTDENPPLVLSGSLGYDSSNANVLGREFMIQLTKSF